MKRLLIGLVVSALVVFAAAQYLKSRYTDTEGRFRMNALDYEVYQLRSGRVPVVEKYLKDNLHNPDSYEPVGWGMLQKITSSEYMVSHTYRATNKMGGLQLQTRIFVIDKLGIVKIKEE